MKYLVATRGVPQRVRAGIWFGPIAAEYELTADQLKAVEADPMLHCKLVDSPIKATMAPAPAKAVKKTDEK